MMLQAGDSKALGNVGKAVIILVTLMFALIWLANAIS